MLLQQIVGVLDAELENLRKLRDIVSGLQGTFQLDIASVRSSQAVLVLDESKATPAKPEIKATRLIKKEARRPRLVQNTKLKDNGALAGNIPTGPVVVSASALAKQQLVRREQQRNQGSPEPVPAVGSLGSMIRALHLDATA